MIFQRPSSLFVRPVFSCRRREDNFGGPSPCLIFLHSLLRHYRLLGVFSFSFVAPTPHSRFHVTRAASHCLCALDSFGPRESRTKENNQTRTTKFQPGNVLGFLTVLVPVLKVETNHGIFRDDAEKRLVSGRLFFDDIFTFF
ncbi:hypothetical protein GALMADRAFT_1051238 [Galerina marginata CBS 339.88]|uniref:Uncharacterized protein n=1 Tax=Galerina marginata (strain CBS 339.88) TaxID=685588 RepID=A0A067SB41_GALM3|nr:hypothetical protein GALMADRAFT_1051238 [Galerina marginata CBS 339.88]